MGVQKTQMCHPFTTMPLSQWRCKSPPYPLLPPNYPSRPILPLVAPHLGKNLVHDGTSIIKPPLPQDTLLFRSLNINLPDIHHLSIKVSLEAWSNLLSFKTLEHRLEPLKTLTYYMV